jgi:hypothetical protein
VARLDRHDLRCDVVERTAVPVLALDVPAREEADVRVHAEVGSHGGLHVRRPAEAGRIDRPLHAPVSGADDVHRGAAHLAMVGALDRCDQRIHGAEA